MYSNDYLIQGIATQLFTLVLCLLILVFSIVCQWRVFSKAGIEGWKAVVPVYNTMQLLMMAGFNPWLALATIVPCVNFLFAFFLCYVNFKLAKCFGLSTALCIVGIFIPVIPYAVIAFNPSVQYEGVV